MVQTDQAWDWGVELRDEERSELDILRGTVAQLRRQLAQAHDSLRMSRRREQDASPALRQLDEARPLQRRRVRRRYAAANCSNPASDDESASTAT